MAFDNAKGTGSNVSTRLTKNKKVTAGRCVKESPEIDLNTILNSN